MTEGPWYAEKDGSVWSTATGEKVADTVVQWGREAKEWEDNTRRIAALPEVYQALTDALESLKRLPNVDGAYRVTCIQQIEKALEKAKPKSVTA